MCVLRRRPVTIIPANIARLSRLPQSSLLSPTLPAADAAAAATVESKLMMMVIRRRNFGKCSPSARDHLSIYLSIYLSGQANYTRRRQFVTRCNFADAAVTWPVVGSTPGTVAVAVAVVSQSAAV